MPSQIPAHPATTAPDSGYTHAPVALHDVAPHAPATHAAAQQLPVPATPQRSLSHWPFAVHVPPAASSQ